MDVGLRSGLALYRGDGRLRWYRSTNFGSAGRLKRGAYGLIRELEGSLSVLVAEGGGALTDTWRREAERRDLRFLQVDAETWRRQLLLPRERRSGTDAKANADAAARRVIEWSGAPRPTALRHDAAEAVLVGLWGVLRVGWLDAVPEGL